MIVDKYRDGTRCTSRVNPQKNGAVDEVSKDAGPAPRNALLTLVAARAPGLKDAAGKWLAWAFEVRPATLQGCERRAPEVTAAAADALSSWYLWSFLATVARGLAKAVVLAERRAGGPEAGASLFQMGYWLLWLALLAVLVVAARTAVQRPPVAEVMPRMVLIVAAAADVAALPPAAWLAPAGTLPLVFGLAAHWAVAAMAWRSHGVSDAHAQMSREAARLLVAHALPAVLPLTVVLAVLPRALLQLAAAASLGGSLYLSLLAVKSLNTPVFNAARLETAAEHFLKTRGQADTPASVLAPAAVARRIRGHDPLHTRVDYGVSLAAVLAEAGAGLTTAQKHALVQSVEGALATTGRALLADLAAKRYYVLRREGMPRTRDGTGSGALPEGAQHMSDSQYEALADLWAYFYAVAHNAARRDGASSGAEAQGPTLVVIESLAADGTFNPASQASPMLALYRAPKHAAAVCGPDALLPVFTEFLIAADAQGWNLDECYHTDEGHRVDIHYL